MIKLIEVDIPKEYCLKRNNNVWFQLSSTMSYASQGINSRTWKVGSWWSTMLETIKSLCMNLRQIGHVSSHSVHSSMQEKWNIWLQDNTADDSWSLLSYPWRQIIQSYSCMLSFFLNSLNCCHLPLINAWIYWALVMILDYHANRSSHQKN